MKKSTSTYYFLAKLSDPGARYQLQRAHGHLIDGFIFEVFLNGLCIHGTTQIPFDQLKNKVRESLDILISIFVFQTGKRLSYTLDNWVEAKKVRVKDDEVGWFLSHTGKIRVSKETDNLNQPWRRAIWLYNNLSKGNNNHRLAIKDYYHAISDASTDAFFYAYRSIEDICRAVTGKDDISSPTWKIMHKKLNNKTSEKMIKPLTIIAESVRHGKNYNSLVIKANVNRDRLIKIAHKIIEVEIERTFPQFYRIN